MNDREFRRRAHALLKKHSGGALIDENGRCVECGGVEGTWEFKHKDDCEVVALIIAEARQTSAGLRRAIMAAVERDGVCQPYRIAETMDAPAHAVPAVIRDLGLVIVPLGKAGRDVVYGRAKEV